MGGGWRDNKTAAHDNWGNIGRATLLKTHELKKKLDRTQRQ